MTTCPHVMPLCHIMSKFNRDVIWQNIITQTDDLKLMNLPLTLTRMKPKLTTSNHSATMIRNSLLSQGAEGVRRIIENSSKHCKGLWEYSIKVPCLCLCLGIVKHTQTNTPKLGVCSQHVLEWSWGSIISVRQPTSQGLLN